MSEEKKTKAKAQAKTPAKDPVVYVLYRGDAEIVDVVTGAESAMSQISNDRDLHFVRAIVKRQKRGSR